MNDLQQPDDRTPVESIATDSSKQLMTDGEILFMHLGRALVGRILETDANCDPPGDVLLRLEAIIQERTTLQRELQEVREKLTVTLGRVLACHEDDSGVCFDCRSEMAKVGLLEPHSKWGLDGEFDNAEWHKYFEAVNKSDRCETALDEAKAKLEASEAEAKRLKEDCERYRSALEWRPSDYQQFEYNELQKEAQGVLKALTQIVIECEHTEQCEAFPAEEPCVCWKGRVENLLLKALQ